MHNKTVYFKTTHSVLCLAHEAMRQAHSHLTGTFGEPSKQIIAFSSQPRVTMYTRLPLQKRDDRSCSPRRPKIFTRPSVQQCWLLPGLQVSMALSVWQLVCKGSWDCLSREMSLIPEGRGLLKSERTSDVSGGEVFNATHSA